MQRVFELVRQGKPDLLFPENPVSKRKTHVANFNIEQEARSPAFDDAYFHYEVRERVFRWIRKSGFMRGKGKMSGKLIPVHDIEVRETISLKTLPALERR